MKLQPRHDITLLLSKLIYDYKALGKTVESKKIWTWEDFVNQELPTEDIPKIAGDYKLIASLTTNKYLRAAVQLLGADESTNAILYYPQSVMQWHTNSDMVGQRIYYTYTKGPAAFMYINANGERVIDHDNIGWTCRTFDIKGSDNPLWHTVWTQEERYSFGFWIK